MPLHRRHGLVLPLLAAGCAAGDDADEQPFTVRDSAGVVIVESHAPAWQEHSGWHLSAEPQVQIGVQEGPPVQQLFRPRSARRLPDGRILVANTGTQEVRLYGTDGRHLRTLGGSGRGPGEFGNLWDAWPWPGDSILAFDAAASRATIFHEGGEVGRTFALGDGLRPETLVRATRAGTLITRALETPSPGDEVRHIRLFHRDRDGRLLDSIGRFPSRSVARRGEAGVLSHRGEIFGAVTRVAATDARVLVARGRVAEIEVWSVGGVMERLIRWPQEGRQVTAEHRARYVEEQASRARSDAEAAGLRAELMAARFADEFPTLQWLLVDSEGSAWALRYSRPGEEEEGPTWAVFEAEGRLLGDVAFPAGFTPSDIGADYVLGTARDSLGVERVRLYGLVKP